VTAQPFVAGYCLLLRVTEALVAGISDESDSKLSADRSWLESAPISGTIPPAPLDQSFVRLLANFSMTQ
jgi:anthranilate/para-aminobenzoate synthase component I